MARAYRGPYARASSYNVPYAVGTWGDGIDPIHAQYGQGPPLRVQGREGTLGSSPVSTQTAQGRDYQQPAESSGDEIPAEMSWGYPVDYGVDSFGSGADSSPSTVAPATYDYMGERPAWNEAPEHQRVRATSTMTPWSRSGARLRAMRMGAWSYRRNPNGPITAQQSNELPNETVSEGWLNKVTSRVAFAHPSDPSQYVVQTSMTQRFRSRDNRRAVARGTDDERAPIESRVMAMVRKQYSTGERSYDMFPYQIDQMERPFHFRTAGTGRQDWMEVNAVNPMSPIQRVPPPDASMGIPEVASDENFGYTGEDTMYYA